MAEQPCQVCSVWSVTSGPSLDCGSQNETGLSGNLGFLTSTSNIPLIYVFSVPNLCVATSALSFIRCQNIQDSKIPAENSIQCWKSIKKSDLSRVHVHVGGVVSGHVEAKRVVSGWGARLCRFSKTSPPVGEPHLSSRKWWEGDQCFDETPKLHLYPCLTQLGPLAELLPGVDVGVLGPLEGLLQLVQLVSCERCPRPSLLALQGDFHSRQMRGLRWKERVQREVENFRFKLRISGSPWGESQARPPYLTRLQTLHPQVWLQWNQNVRDGKRLTRKVGWGSWRRGGTLCRKWESSSYYFLPAVATHFEI